MEMGKHPSQHVVADDEVVPKRRRGMHGDKGQQGVCTVCMYKL
jgi:hypothetical protein